MPTLWEGSFGPHYTDGKTEVESWLFAGGELTIWIQVSRVLCAMEAWQNKGLTQPFG